MAKTDTKTAPKTDPETDGKSAPEAEPGADASETLRSMLRNLFPEPGKVVEAAREATLSGLDGSLALHEELQAAWGKGFESFRRETDAWADLVQKAADESAGMSYDLTRRSLERFRNDVARFGRAPSA